MWISSRVLAIALLLISTGCSQKDKSAKFMRSKDHHCPASAERFVMAQQREAVGDLDMAKQLYAMVVADYPDHPVATQRLEAILIATGEWNMHAPRTAPRFHEPTAADVSVAATSHKAATRLTTATQLKTDTRQSSATRRLAAPRGKLVAREKLATRQESTTLAVASDEPDTPPATETTVRIDPAGFELVTVGTPASLGEIEASLSDFEQSESGFDSRKHANSTSATVSNVCPAELSGHIEFVN